MLVKQKDLFGEERSKIETLGKYPIILDLDENMHKLHGKESYISPKLDGVNLRIIYLDENRYALLTRQGYVADEFINSLNKFLPSELFNLADKYVTAIELESSIIPTTSSSLCDYHVIDLFDSKQRMLPISQRTAICEQYKVKYSKKIANMNINTRNEQPVKKFAMKLIKNRSLEGLIFEIENGGEAYKLRYKNIEYESKTAKAEQEYSKLFLETGISFLEFENVESKIKGRLTREFGALPSPEFIMQTYTEYCQKIQGGADHLIKQYSSNSNFAPLSILLGGNNGVGKTTLARELSNRLKMDHRIGTGLIREILKPANPNLLGHTWDAANELNLATLYDGLQIQATLLNKSITDLLNRSNEEGTSIVIEGNHLTPEIMEQSNVILKVILNVSDSDELYSRVLGKSHTKRKVTNADFAKIWNIQNEILVRAQHYDIPIIENTNLPLTLDKTTVLLGINLLPNIYRSIQDGNN